MPLPKDRPPRRHLQITMQYSYNKSREKGELAANCCWPSHQETMSMVEGQSLPGKVRFSAESSCRLRLVFRCSSFWVGCHGRASMATNRAKKRESLSEHAHASVKMAPENQVETQ